MTTLGVETSSTRGGVALWGIDRPVSAMMEEPLRHAEELLDLTDHLLERCGVARAELDRVSVNQGPGSFTGLRIGIATAKGLCQALKIPLVGVDGTVACRAEIEDARARVCVILKNRRDLFYVRWFIGERAQGPVEVLDDEAIVARLRRDNRPVWIVGDGGVALRETLHSVPEVRWPAKEAVVPSPLVIARLGEEQSGADRLYELEPAYVEPVLFKKKRQRKGR
jgi:tRNA threonylcarbamoyladenosine biosynthesis protein TsaB